MLLLPIIEKSGPSRIVTVSSMGHKTPFKELNLETISDPNKYNKYIHYGKSKVRKNLISNKNTQITLFFRPATFYSQENSQSVWKKRESMCMPTLYILVSSRVN